ncbi:alpha/beta hydrolase family protein [Halobacillus salinus]|uniref:alpha/beta hydrolase family protein n=1 Tax=Halobacillus salinus TaxID=192814 RepID=UPI0009A8BAE0|nr:alpha/beta fold hydrolase [Halobacillus salinus]
MKNDKPQQHYAGYKRLTIMDDYLDVTFPVMMMYPTDIPEQAETIGPYKVNVAKNAPPKDDTYPLVLISHGTGGTPLVYRTLARHLAQNGFVVAMPEHPFNNVHDNQLENTTKLLKSRPRNITQTIDGVVGDAFFKSHIDGNDISIIGHSMGGYTAVAATGGTPSTLPWETPETIEVDVEQRIKRVILLAPALGWFMKEGALDEFSLPTLMMTGEKDTITPHFHAGFLLNGVRNPGLIDHKVIHNAGHFSFLSPFPEERKDPSFPPSQDPEGFDRELFRRELESDIVHFLRQ